MAAQMTGDVLASNVFEGWPDRDNAPLVMPGAPSRAPGGQRAGSEPVLPVGEAVVRGLPSPEAAEEDEEREIIPVGAAVALAATGASPGRRRW